MIHKLFILIVILIINSNNLIGQIKYENDQYGFSGIVPNDWILTAEIKDDAPSNRAIICWGMPKVYSELEKASIDNAISITAYKLPSLKNTEDVVNLELNRIGHIFVSKEYIDSIIYPSYIFVTIRNGLKYKSKVSFVFKNNIGYVLCFTATPGTYDKNLSKFDKFVQEIVFTEPKVVSQTQSESNKKVRYDGLYVAKTLDLNDLNKRIDLYTYIKFCPDGNVYTQSVNSFEPKKVFEWFGKNGQFERKGSFRINGVSIGFKVTNNESNDKKIEGPKTDIYGGTITDENKIYLEIKYNDGVLKDYWFEFIKVP